MIVFCSRERNQHVRATNVKHQPGFPAVVINPSDTKCAGPFCYFLLNKLFVSNELFNLCKNHHGKLLVKAQILKHMYLDIFSWFVNEQCEKWTWYILILKLRSYYLTLRACERWLRRLHDDKRRYVYWAIGEKNTCNSMTKIYTSGAGIF